MFKPFENPLYAAAATRIDETPELEPYREAILYDWPDEHYRWAATCDLEELISWAERFSGED